MSNLDLKTLLSFCLTNHELSTYDGYFWTMKYQKDLLPFFTRLPLYEQINDYQNTFKAVHLLKLNKMDIQLGKIKGFRIVVLDKINVKPFGIAFPDEASCAFYFYPEKEGYKIHKEFLFGRQYDDTTIIEVVSELETINLLKMLIPMNIYIDDDASWNPYQLHEINRMLNLNLTDNEDDKLFLQNRQQFIINNPNYII